MIAVLRFVSLGALINIERSSCRTEKAGISRVEFAASCTQSVGIRDVEYLTTASGRYSPIQYQLSGFLFQGDASGEGK